MKKEEITYLLQNPAAISFGQTGAIREIIDQYPFFQAARAVYLKGLKNANSLHYNKELKVTAAYTTDRAVLFDFITSEEFNQNQIASEIRKQEQRQKDREHREDKEENITLDQALKMKLRESEQVFDPELFRRSEKEQNKIEKDRKEDSLQLGSPLRFDKNENHSFTEWLKLATAKPIEREGTGGNQEDPKSRKYDLINEFIAKNPRIDPAKNTRKINLAEENMAGPESLMTETLARVYLEQKNYKKAIQAYKILILKNPEKSGFFADQIRAIEKLQDNNN
ncbi:hypothetical protein [Salinimicrobium flavum]|uniref:Tetratricopeptide repeat-containing protein n=1 Tax=Salinimicrobium flavum TaxID=1737065 RepID=A0ABW5IY01_9FLAO